MAIWYLPIFWQANDDIAMANLANGRLTGTLEWKLVFINPLWGLLLKGLYSISRSVPWYPVLFVLVQGLGWALFFRASGLLSIGWQKWAWAFAIWAGMAFYALLQLQFTTVASFPAVAALLFIMAQMRYCQTPGQAMARVWPAVLCFWMCWLVRKEALYLVVVIALPLLVWLALTDRAVFRKALPPLVLLGLLCGAAILTEKLSYTGPAWERYKEYNWMRGQLQDSRRIEFDADPALMAQMGWNRTDHELFYHFRQDRDERFSLKAVSQLYARKSALAQPESTWKKVEAEWKAIQFQGWAWTRFGFAALLLLLAGIRRGSVLATAVATMAASLGVAAAFILILILKERVLLALLFQAVASTYFLAFYHRPPVSAGRLALTAAGLVLAALSAKSALSQGFAYRRQLPETYSYLFNLKAIERQNPIVDFYSGSLAVNDPFHHMRLPLAYSSLRPIPTGWLTYSPFQTRAMERVGYDPDKSLFLQAAQDPRATFLLDHKALTLLEAYLEERLGRSVRFLPANEKNMPDFSKPAQFRALIQ